MLEKTFDYAEAEQRLYAAWEKAGRFAPSGKGDPFSIVIPPPNVTGSLHMGHALNNTLQDILSRFERMRGRSVLWQPGTDHAGIATQMVVERQLAERQEPSRREQGREQFVERVWQWRHESGGQIINQLKRLGASCDWSRERFTMGDNGGADDQMVQAVIKVFIDLYNEGLIYRDKRLVNWDPKFETAISDLEVENIEVDGHFWHFKYPLENGETYEYVEKDEDGTVTLREMRDYISIATTRPETMLGDGAVAVHPSDERYAPIVGKRCLLPLAERYIPIVADEHPDPDFGSGAVKITGAHDFNDYQVARRHNLPMYVLFDSKAQMRADENEDNPVPEKYRGMDRFEARQAVVDDLEAEGRLIEVEDKKIMQPFGDRSNVVIEPMLTDQWYVDAKTLAEPAIKAVENGKTKFVPENWAKTYFQWMNNIEPWCISRQLWWGHRIPAWYGPSQEGDDFVLDGGQFFIAENESNAEDQAEAFYGRPVVSLASREEAVRYLAEANSAEQINAIPIWQDEDVLDTWFSSALWPFSTMGWPHETKELKAYYPTSVLITAHDIIFFWVARMMMQGIHFMEEIPFTDVYIHALVLDEKGQKMSKSKGNVIDPLVLIDKFGADALRFTLAAQAAQGRNIRLSEQRVEGYRNFTTKLWNAARFCEMNECAPVADFDSATASLALNKWIIHEVNECAAAVTRELEAYRFNDAAGAIYRFSWNVFCDWYLEFAKPVLQGPDGEEKDETRAAAAFALGRILQLLHPFMPFVSEELWNKLGFGDALIVAPWPTFSEALAASDAAEELNWTIALISEIRSVRQTVDLPAGEKFRCVHVADLDDVSARLQVHRELIEKLARVRDLETVEEGAAPRGVALIANGSTFILDVAETVDLGAVETRLEKSATKAEKEISVIDKKLGNKNFVDRAPAEVVDEQKARRANYVSDLEKLNAALERLKSI